MTEKKKKKKREEKCGCTGEPEKDSRLHLSKVLFHWTIITCCNVFRAGNIVLLFVFFCPIDQPCKTLQTVQVNPRRVYNLVSQSTQKLTKWINIYPPPGNATA